MRKGERQIIIGACSRALANPDTAAEEIRKLQMWAEAPDLCGECRGLAIDCTVCGGRAYVKRTMKP